jgi:tetratricopeptide (TPR) repeat protein
VDLTALDGNTLEQARAYYNAGNFRQSREIAVQALAEQPDDVDLLRIAARASLDLNADGAAEYLKRVAELNPGDAAAWRELGDALMYEGRAREALDAFRRTVELRPDDTFALVNLGHTAYAAGEPDEAISALEQALDREPGSVQILRSLVEMYRRAGRSEDALATAREIVKWRPDDVLSQLDIAELSLRLSRLDDAISAYSRLRALDREIDDDREAEVHEVYAYHGMIQAEIAREGWRRALDLAVDATRVDRYGRTTDVLSFVVARVFGAGDRPAPTRSEVEAALALSHAEHRRLHTEALAL